MTAGRLAEAELRRAVALDAPAVARVLIDSRKAFMPFAASVHSTDDVLAWVARHLLPTGGVQVAVIDGQVVAVLAVAQTAECAWIEQLYVLPGFEARGLGTALLRHAHAGLKRPIRLYCFQQNRLARRFYERHGYRVLALSDGQGNEERCPDVLYQLQALGQPMN